MALTKANIHAEIRSLLNEATAGFFTNEEIDSWIDQAAIDISSKTLCYEQSSPITLMKYQIDYAYPMNCIKVVACLYDNKGLVRIDPEKLGNLTGKQGGPPGFFCDWAKKIYIEPVPNEAYNGQSVTVLFAAQTNDITNIDEQFKVHAILFGLWRGKLKDRKYGEASQVLNSYLNFLLFNRQDLLVREVTARSDRKIPDSKKS